MARQRLRSPRAWVRLVLIAPVLFALLGLSACGFQPLHRSADGRAAAQQGFPAVYVGLIPDRLGQILRNELLDRVNPRGEARSPRYRLEVAARESRSDIVILRDSTATFAKFSVEADWSLVDLTTNAPVTRGTLRRTSSFSISQSEFAILQAEADARRRAATELAEDIHLRLALFFKQSAG